MSLKIYWSDRLEALAEKLFSDWEQRPSSDPFAMTVHKSQGSEFRDVAIILPPDGGSRLLTREILYTGITRTKKMVFLFGSDKAVEKSCKSVVSRVTGFIDLEN